MGLIICKTKDQILTNFKIRFEVFNKEQNVPYELDMDLAEFNGEMFLYADENEEYVACARMIYEENRAHIGRIATLKEYRGRGYASKMISSIFNALILPEYGFLTESIFVFISAFISLHLSNAKLVFNSLQLIISILSI